MRSAPLTSAAGAALVALAVAPAHARADCDGADRAPDGQDLPQVRGAVVCLLDAQRAAYALPPLRAQDELQASASAYSSAMVRRRFFAHVSPAGRTIVDRVAASGYLRPAGDWALGEDLAWGSGQDATAREVVAAWMASPPHRGNILERAFRDVGVGVAVGLPDGASAGATYTTDFGVRTLHRRHR
jgi:uncharacterized protein YkwD